VTAPAGDGHAEAPSTRERLLAEAVRRLGRAGYEGTSLDAVASAAGVRKQTLLYYFPTKEALLEACVGEVSTKVGLALADALAAQESESQKAETVIRAVFRLAEEWPEFPQFIREAARMSPEVITRFAAGLEPLRQRALSFLDRGMSEGQIRRQDPALLLFTLYTAVVGSLTEAGVLRAVVGEDSSRTALRRREQEVLAFVRSAMAPSDPAPEAERAAR
jgi:TetR/AcrR family transcriptional regulator